jgi:hypothetical protein
MMAEWLLLNNQIVMLKNEGRSSWTKSGLLTSSFPPQGQEAAIEKGNMHATSCHYTKSILLITKIF